MIRTERNSVAKRMEFPTTLLPPEKRFLVSSQYQIMNGSWGNRLVAGREKTTELEIIPSFPHLNPHQGSLSRSSRYLCSKFQAAPLPSVLCPLSALDSALPTLNHIRFHSPKLAAGHPPVSPTNLTNLVPMAFR